MKKVHTKIVINMLSDEVVSDEFYWYPEDGKWEKCDDENSSLRGVEEAFVRPFIGPGDFDAGNAPTGTAESEVLGGFNEAFQEFSLRQQGIKSVPVQGGFRFVEIPEGELELAVGARRAEELKADRANRGLFTERLNTALKGELADPGFERRVEEQRKQLVLEIERESGINSTVGGQRLAAFDLEVETARSDIGRGEISGLAGEERVRGASGQSLTNSLLETLRSGRQFSAGLSFDFAQLGQDRDLAELAAQAGREAGQQRLAGEALGAAPAIFAA